MAKTIMESMAATTSFSVSAIPSLKPLEIRYLKFQSYVPLNFRQLKQNHRKFNVVKASSPGLFSAEQFELTVENVDKVLENVRPYLIADGGNVEVVSVDNGVVSLKLQAEKKTRTPTKRFFTKLQNKKLLGLYLKRERETGVWVKTKIARRHCRKIKRACESCPSSTTTMKMGIERVLKEKFGDAIRDISQVYDEQVTDTTVEAVNNHLDILRPAIKNYGGSVQVLSVSGGDCLVNYVGPDSIGSGIKAAIKERFPDIANVEFTN